MTQPDKTANHRTNTQDDREGRSSSRRAPDAVPEAKADECAAVGGDETGPLVVKGNNSAAPASPTIAVAAAGLSGLGVARKRLLADRARTLIAETCGDMREADKVRGCGVNVTAGLTDVAVERSPNGHAFTSGLQTCGSVWICPICSFKIRIKRAMELATAIAAHKAAGGSVLLLTLTTQHSYGESLKLVWSTIQDVWAHVTSHSRYRKLKAHHRMEFVRTVEVMHGVNGWHPHIHALLFVDGTVGPFDRRDEYNEIARVFHDLWVYRMRNEYGRDVRSSVGVDLRPVKADDADGVGMYCTKAGYEVAMADGKEGRTRTSRHPFAIAYDAVETGNTADINLFRDWIAGSHGRQMWSWSQDLRKKLGLAAEKTDEELANEAEETIGRVCTVSKKLWRQIARTRYGLRAAFLATLDQGRYGIDDAVALLLVHGLDVAVETRSPGDPPRLVGSGEPRETPAINQPSKETSSV